MKRTQKQINNIKKGCLNGDKQAIINAQKKRHLKAKLNQKAINEIQTILTNLKEETKWKLLRAMVVTKKRN